MTDDEQNTRSALAWAIGETTFKLPLTLQQVENWKWDRKDVSLYALRDDGEFRFHVGAQRTRSRKVRIAVMTITDDNGEAKWEGYMLPNPVAGEA